MTDHVIKLGMNKTSTFIEKVKALLPQGGNLNLCLTCGACSSGCPATGLDGMDPRKFLRMAALGMDEEIKKIGLALDVHHVPTVHLRVPHANRYSPTCL
jgi:heterodisulfide reductase subunit C